MTVKLNILDQFIVAKVASRVSASLKSAVSYDSLVKNKEYLPKPLTKVYLKALSKYVGNKGDIKVISSETTMPRGWDSGNITFFKVIPKESDKTLDMDIKVLFGDDEVSGNARIDGTVVATPRATDFDQWLRQLMSELGDNLAYRLSH